MKTLLLAASFFFCALLTPSNVTLAAPMPVTVSWSQFFGARATWSQANTYATNLVEGGYSDWRLPTRAEFQTAISGGTMPALTPNTAWWYWTSERQGNRAWVVTIVTDANGNVLPAQSGSTSKQLQVSLLASIGIRP